jgi:ABC-type lipoprotein export system ATPase subunit
VYRSEAGHWRGAGFAAFIQGQRILVGDQVLSYQELAQYFNAKKNVSLPQIFIRVNRDSDEVELERARSREAALEVTFGLKVKVKALKDVDAELNGTRLRAGTLVEATLQDRIVFHNDSELDLLDLRRRARALGGRFQLKASKSEYLVSNNPSLLEADDILLSPGTAGDVLLKIFCDYDKRIGTLEVLEADRPIMVGETNVRTASPLKDGDTIRIDVGQFLKCNFSERIIEEERNIIRTLEVSEVTHHFSSGDIGLEGISFNVVRGELVCVMGASGSGKSTLLKVLAGQLEPTSGQVLLNNQQLYPNLDQLKRYISYIPQEDAFDEHLTIGENLQFAAAIRSPHLSRRDRSRRLEGKLVELGLSERRDAVVGTAIKKTLSGGERKRLNIGLDMIGSADVYLFDEPTSGSAQKIPSTSSKSFVRWPITKSSSSPFTNRARNFSRCFTKPFCSTRAGGWSSSGPRLRCCVISRKQNTSTNSALTWEPARPAERPDQNLFSMFWKRRCVI